MSQPHSFRFAVLVALSIAMPMGMDGYQARADDHSATKPVEAYTPGLGDFMTAYVQPHHIKVWLAGHANNWPLAEYEAKELRETFGHIVTYKGDWHDLPVAKLIETNVYAPLAEVQAAIKDHDAAGFQKAYDRLTVACNSCHQATNNGSVVIKTPYGTGFPDQEFQPGKP